MKERIAEFESHLVVLLGENEELSNPLKETRCAKVLCETNLLRLQKSLSKKKEDLCDRVYKQLTSDLLARDKQNQNEGW